MKRLAIMAVLGLSVFALPALAEQKLINITEDTLANDSYRPVAGKEFLVAIKLVNVDIELNTETPISNEPIIFQTSVGTLSETEVTTNIYGEAITWLTTDTTPDTSHSITVSAQDKPEITPITIEIKNIALPQDAPAAEELIQKVEENNAKIQDIKGDITVASDAPWGVSNKTLKIWKKGEKQKVQEISPSPGVFIRPPIPEPPANMQILKEIVSYNSFANGYGVHQQIDMQTGKYPYSIDFIDSQKSVIVKQQSYIGNEEAKAINKSETVNGSYQWHDPVWLFHNQKRYVYEGTGKIAATEEYSYSNMEINTGLPDSIFQ